MTINQHDRVSTGRDDESGVPQSSHALVDRLTAGEPYAVAFGGQGGAWLENLEELVSSAGIESELSELVGEAALLLEPVARELIVVRPIGFEPMQWVRALAAEEAVPTAKHLTSAAVSGARRAADPDGRRARAEPPGHGSARNAARRGGRALAGRAGRRGAGGKGRQGRRAAGAGAADRCRGHAGGPSPRHLGARRQARRWCRSPTPTPTRIAALLEEFAQDVRTVLPPVLSIRNGRRSVVITGTPEQLSPLRALLRADRREGRSRAQEQDSRRRGVQPGFRSGAGRGRLPHPAAVGRHRHGRRLGRRPSGSTSTSPARWPRPSWCGRVDWVERDQRPSRGRRAAGSSTSAPATS